MKSITAYQILAVLAMASSILGAPITNVERGVPSKQELSNDPHKAVVKDTPVGKVDKLVLDQDVYADAMHGAMGTPVVGHIPAQLLKNPALNAVKVKVNVRSPAPEPVEISHEYVNENVNSDLGCKKKRSPQDDDSGSDPAEGDDNSYDDDNGDWEKRYTPESLVKVHVLADHTTSGKDGVINAGTDRGQNAHLIQTPGKSENVAHLRISPPGSPEKDNLYVNVPSDMDGNKIPPGGVAKTTDKTESKAKNTVSKNTGLGGDLLDAKKAVKVVNLPPVAEAYVDGPFLNGRDESAVEQRDVKSKVAGKASSVKNKAPKAPSGDLINLKAKVKIETGKGGLLNSGVLKRGEGLEERATSVQTLKLRAGQIPKSMHPCDGAKHKPDDLVDVCIDARMLSLAPKGTGACPNHQQHGIDAIAKVKIGGAVKLCVNADVI